MPKRKKMPEDDLALRFVDPEDRVELTRFERDADAEIACGLLRANGIPCETTDLVAPIMPGETILWVPKRDLKTAWKLINGSEHKLSFKKKPKSGSVTRRSA